MKQSSLLLVAIGLLLSPVAAQAKVFISQRITHSDKSMPTQDVGFYITRTRVMIQTFHGLNYNPHGRWYREQGGKKIPIQGGARDYIYEGKNYMDSIVNFEKREVARQPLERAIPDRVNFEGLITDKEIYKKLYDKFQATNRYGKITTNNGVFWCVLYKGQNSEKEDTEVWVAKGVVQIGQPGWSNYVVFEPDTKVHPYYRYPYQSERFAKASMVIDYPVKVIRYGSKGDKTETDTHQVTVGAGFDDSALHLPQGFSVKVLPKLSTILKARPNLPDKFKWAFDRP